MNDFSRRVEDERPSDDRDSTPNDHPYIDEMAEGEPREPAEQERPTSTLSCARIYTQKRVSSADCVTELLFLLILMESVMEEWEYS